MTKRFCKLTALNNVLEHFERIRNEDSLYQIVFEEKDGKRHGIGNVDAKNILLDTAIQEIKRQISIEQQQ